MLRQMPWQVFLDWQAFDKIEPIGGLRGDWQAATVAATSMNIAAARAGSKRRLAPRDMLLEYGDEKPREVVKEEPKTTGTSWQQMKWIARMHVADSKASAAKKRK